MTIGSSRASQTVRQALALAASQPRKALEILDSGIARARAISDSASTSRLASHAAVIAEQSGELERATQYYADALEGEPTDPYLYIALGSLKLRLNNVSEAKSAFERALNLGNATGAQEVIEVA